MDRLRQATGRILVRDSDVPIDVALRDERNADAERGAGQELGAGTAGACPPVSQSLVVTCSHVVLMAKANPGDSLIIEFSLASEVQQKRDRHYLPAEVVEEFWSWPFDWDIAVLRLLTPLPRPIEPLGSSGKFESGVRFL